MTVRIAAAILALVLVAADSPAVSRAAIPQTVRVGILREMDQVVIMSDGAIQAEGGGTRTELGPAAYEVRTGSWGIEITGVGQFASPLRLAPHDGARLFVAIRPYRGTLELRRTAENRLTVINELAVEEYLYGVLKREISPSWPVEALKAQAVASRTLAAYSVGRYRAEGYDLRATTESQVYGGMSAEDPRTTAAVDATRGEIITYQGRTIFPAYHSDSGGVTESSEHVWGGRYPYLKGVPDPFTSSAPWTVRMDVSVLEDLLRQRGKTVMGITAIEIAQASPSGRARTVRIVSSTGILTMRSSELRTMIGAAMLKSTLFTVQVFPGEPAVVEFTGRGNGHGVGLSQWGARGLALLGKSYTEILRYYYTGVDVESR